MQLFKYLSADGCLSALKNRTLRANNPSKFNDPFEFAVVGGRLSREQLIEFFSSDEMIAWQYSNNTQGLDFDAFKKQHLSNAPHNIELMLRDQDRGFIPDIAKHYLELVARKYYVASAGCTPQSILMWSHYTDKHAGAALLIETDEIIDERIQAVMPVSYRTQRAGFVPGLGSLDPPSDATLTTLTTKALPWAYEEEIRIIVRIPNGHREEHLDLPIPVSAIKSVIAGMRASDPFKADLRALSRSDDLKHVTWMQCVMDPREYHFSFVELF